MAVSTRLIRHRIKSVKNTRKITKAMELTSSAKMRKAVNAVLGTRPYTSIGWEMILELAKQVDPTSHPLLRKSEKRERILVLAIFSDRGLCGGYNSQLLRRLKTIEHLHKQGVVKIDVIAVGRKGVDIFRKSGMNVIAAFTNISNNPTWVEVRPISKMILDGFMESNYDEVILAYTDYHSAIKQIPRIRTLLPLKPEVVSDELGAIGVQAKPEFPPQWSYYEYLFEPNPEEVLSAILPRLVEVQVFQAVLESTASEHSARMFAMRNATEAAGEMIDDLTFTFNQVRQASITREISEISAGKAALE